MKRYFQLITHLAFPQDLLSIAPGKPGDVVELDAERCKVFGRFLRLRVEARDLREGTIEIRDGRRWFVPLDEPSLAVPLDAPAPTLPDAPHETPPAPPAAEIAPPPAMPSSPAPSSPADPATPKE